MLLFYQKLCSSESLCPLPGDGSFHFLWWNIKGALKLQHPLWQMTRQQRVEKQKKKQKKKTGINP